MTGIDEEVLNALKAAEKDYRLMSVLFMNRKLIHSHKEAIETSDYLKDIIERFESSINDPNPVKT